MQAMDMGSVETTLTQIPSITPSESSSYYLQLDPSGHVDILDSSLVLSKPDMANETVYEIQFDSFMRDERNVEIINLPNLPNFQGSFTIQPEFLQTLPPQQQYTTTVTYEPQPLQFHIDEANFNQMLLGNNVTILTPPPPPVTTINTAQVKTEVVEDDGFVPEYIVETEIAAESNEENRTGAPEPKNESAQDEDSSSSDYSESESESETPESSTQESETVTAKTGIKRKRRILPDNIMEFTGEPVMPPLKVLYPTRPEAKIPQPPSPTPAPIVTVSDEEDDDYEMEWNANADSTPVVPQFLPDNMDPDDELYISFYSRPDASKTVLCVLCYEWFETQVDLDTHLKSVHQDNMKLYGCKRCGKQFWSRFLRQRHEKTHRYDIKAPPQRYFPKNRPFDHYETNHYLKRLRKAPLTQEFLDHLKVIHSEVKSMEYECFECNKDFQDEEEYREHCEEEHVIQTCIHCRNTFDNAKCLRKHEQEVHGKITFDKNYEGGAWKLWESSWDCDEIKEKNDRLVNLYLYHNYSKRLKNEAQPFADCDNFGNMGCEEITVSMREANKLTEKRKPEKSRRSSKGTGKSSSKSKKSKSTPTSTPVKVQIKIEPADPVENASDPDLPFKCEQCKTAYDSEADLQRHLKTHTIRSMAYMCQYCGRGFATHSNRKEHERIHTGDKPYVCPSKSFTCHICSRAFVQISNLKKHIQTHKDKNNLQCSTCQKQFVKESSLILHQRAHSQDRKFRCHVCDRAYNYASLLKRHMRIHTGENPYSCEDCGMMFHELVSLHYHRKKVHTGERPHRCIECGRAFILSSDLKKHLKIHERDGSCVKSNTTKTYSRKSKVGGPSSDVSNPGAFELPLSTLPKFENGTTVSVTFGDGTVQVNKIASENHMDLDFEDEDDEDMMMKTGESDAEDDDDDDDRALVINETGLLNVSESEQGKTEEKATNNETKEANQTVENNVNADVISTVENSVSADVVNTAQDVRADVINTVENVRADVVNTAENVRADVVNTVENNVTTDAINTAENVTTDIVSTVEPCS